MKQSEKITLSGYGIIGMALVIIGIKTEIEYYSPMIFAMGFALVFGSGWRLFSSWHNTRPENIEKYKEKLHRQEIDLKDERKILLRNRSGYLTWIATMAVCFLAAFIASLMKADSLLIGVLFGAGILEYIAAFVIYKYLCAKM